MNTHVKNVYTPPIGRAHYRHFHVPDEWNDHIKKIIGKDGCNFIRATKQSGCSYIWHHRDTNIIEVWGPHGALAKGERRVRSIARNVMTTTENK